MPQPSELDDFLFDLNGFLVLKNAIEPDLVARLNAAFDEMPRDMELGHWHGGAQRRDYNKDTGLELHNAVAMNGPFAALIDHPSYIDHLRHYCGEENSYVQGLFLDECIASIRDSGGRHSMHSGGHMGALRGKFHYEHNNFRCGQCNIIIALTDIGEGDGPTVVVPGSHKSNFPHPEAKDYAFAGAQSMHQLTGAFPVLMNKGDALLFVDGIIHGGSERTNPGERRITIFRYGPVWAATRFGYTYPAELLDTLTPARRKILAPVPTVIVGDNRIPNDH